MLPLSYQVTDFLGINSELITSRYCSGPCPSMADAEIKPEVHKLIHELVLYIHENEPDIEKSILVFLPTYYALEQQWYFLKPFSSSFKVHILHRSVDTEQALMAMKIWKSHRKVYILTLVISFDCRSIKVEPARHYAYASFSMLDVNFNGFQIKLSRLSK